MSKLSKGPDDYFERLISMGRIKHLIKITTYGM